MKQIFELFLGKWSSWKPWSTCSRTCGRGCQTRARACDDPPPTTGGCKGDALEQRSCDPPNEACLGISWVY